MPEFYKKNLLSDTPTDDNQDDYHFEPQLQSYPRDLADHHDPDDDNTQSTENFAFTPELPAGLEPDHELPPPREEETHHVDNKEDRHEDHEDYHSENLRHHFSDHNDDFWSEEQDYRDKDEDLVKTLMSWYAPSRPFRKRDRSYYTTVAILIGLISLIAVLAGEKILIGALFALGFLVYVLNFVPPEEVEYKISTQGITIGDHFYHWQELDSFWFVEKDGHTLLHVLTDIKFPGVLILVLRQGDMEEVKRICARFLPFHEIAPKTMVEKWAESLQKHFPLENPHR